MILTVQPATPIVISKMDGTGYEVRTAYDGHYVHLQIGNVSIIFDGRNIWEIPKGYVTYLGAVMQFSEKVDCPVKLDNVDCPKCADAAETILFALASDLGYTLSK